MIRDIQIFAKSSSTQTMDVWYMGAWVGWFQVFWTFLFTPLTALPGLHHFFFFVVLFCL
jgi:hypothetical protein